MECYLHYRQLNLKYISEGSFPGFWNWKPVCYIASFLGSVRQPFRLETAWIVPRAVGLLPMENIPRGVSVPWLHLQPLRAQVHGALALPAPEAAQGLINELLVGEWQQESSLWSGIMGYKPRTYTNLHVSLPWFIALSFLHLRGWSITCCSCKRECFCCLLLWQPEENPWLWQVAEQSFGNRMNCSGIAAPFELLEDTMGYCGDLELSEFMIAPQQRKISKRSFNPVAGASGSQDCWNTRRENYSHCGFLRLEVLPHSEDLPCPGVLHPG